MIARNDIEGHHVGDTRRVPDVGRVQNIQGAAQGQFKASGLIQGVADSLSKTFGASPPEYSETNPASKAVPAT